MMSDSNESWPIEKEKKKRSSINILYASTSPVKQGNVILIWNQRRAKIVTNIKYWETTVI